MNGELRARADAPTVPALGPAKRPALFARGLLSVVVPVHNEREVLEEFHRRLSAVLDELRPLEGEIIFVNDGSSDGSLTLLWRLQEADPRVAVLDLSRNFGKEIAMTAGLDHAQGDAVVVIDADLQDPPELIPELVRWWAEGCDVVYARRIERQGESTLKRLTAHAFYRVIRRVGDTPIPEDTGDFRLLSRRAVEALRQLREHHRFMKGLFAWIGYRQKAVPYRRDPRYAGASKFSFWRLWNFSLEGITSFTVAPLKVSSYLGLLIALSAFLFACWIFSKTLFYGDPVPGYPSLMIVILFLGGIQLVILGVIGEYLGRMFNESKRRPLYLVADFRPSSATSSRYGAAPSGSARSRTRSPGGTGLEPDDGAGTSVDRPRPPVAVPPQEGR
jgi:polyisoprenyl-phosphate glycosyltransferase